jgi:hypothetical protein
MARKKTSKESKTKSQKVTAIMPSDLILNLKKATNSKTITESLIKASEDYLRREKFKKLHEEIQKKPLEFTMSWQELKAINRKIT